MFFAVNVSNPHCVMPTGFLGRKTITLSLKVSHSFLTISIPCSLIISRNTSYRALAETSTVFRHALNGMPSLPGELFTVGRVAPRNVEGGRTDGAHVGGVSGEVGKVLAQPLFSKSGIGFLAGENLLLVCFQNADHLQWAPGSIPSLVDNCELLAATARRKTMHQLLVFLPPP